MTEGKVLVIANNESLQYHAKKDLEKHEFSVVIESDEAEAFKKIREDNFDVIMISIEEGAVDDSVLLQNLKGIKRDALVIVVSNGYSDSSINDMQRLGVFDFLPASFEPKNLFLVIKQAMLSRKEKNNIVIDREKIKNLDKQIALLNKKVDEGAKNTASLYRDLQQSYMRSIKALAQALDMRDEYTHSHSENVTKYAVAIGEEMGLSFQDIKDIRDACGLHDIGKIGIRDSILSKEGELTEAEWRLMREHPMKGAVILQHLGLKNVIELVKQHHEHYNGNGYPAGKKGEEIPLGARIISLADSYDAMTSERAYKNRRFSQEEALQEIKQNGGTQFDPKVVAVFLKIIDRFTE